MKKYITIIKQAHQDEAGLERNPFPKTEKKKEKMGLN